MDLYHTSGSPPNEMILPNMPVHPARKTAICSRISVLERVFTRLFLRERSDELVVGVCVGSVAGL